MLSYWQAVDTFELTTLDDSYKNMLHHLLPNVRENSHNLRFPETRKCQRHVKRTNGILKLCSHLWRKRKRKVQHV